jgi:hypothetical protein
VTIDDTPRRENLLGVEALLHSGDRRGFRRIERLCLGIIGNPLRHRTALVADRKVVIQDAACARSLRQSCRRELQSNEKAIDCGWDMLAVGDYPRIATL